MSACRRGMNAVHEEVYRHIADPTAPGFAERQSLKEMLFHCHFAAQPCDWAPTQQQIDARKKFADNFDAMSSHERSEILKSYKTRTNPVGGVL